VLPEKFNTTVTLSIDGDVLHFKDTAKQFIDFTLAKVG
jgi:hypothetical protein